MNGKLLLALALGLLSRTTYAQAPLSPLDSVAHGQSVLAFQQALNQEFSNPSESPLTAEERRTFKSLPYYPTRYRYYVVAQLVRDSTSQPFAMETSTARRPLYRKYGELRFVLNGQALRLNVYQSVDLLKRPGLEDYLFVPFTDLTNGHGSYGGGRYLDLRLPPAGATTMVLDFNRAYNPSCAYQHGYSCPVPPAENRLPVAIPAGVRSDH
ncbi:DUF1684 domain-containing protein [Hymenobacter sp. BT770]|uniref:DUF1684 domain-containing protein n=1 Tax=Hymenobacter sp. BT770 TaxID=2886942 RepID=UPI001D0F5C52|nr:DUF1684 domain-containing protein [Hymenobacter sp. BT770]MCC3151908.1 DUF1684 domain-containing protein [Hymenobacter sp. BT770]MDO3413469.1 DUF1684 domain-containing protein [Hymenobacter sp. BT770]